MVLIRHMQWDRIFFLWNGDDYQKNDSKLEGKTETKCFVQILLQNCFIRIFLPDLRQSFYSSSNFMFPLFEFLVDFCGVLFSLICARIRRHTNILTYSYSPKSTYYCLLFTCHMPRRHDGACNLLQLILARPYPFHVNVQLVHERILIPHGLTHPRRTRTSSSSTRQFLSFPFWITRFCFSTPHLMRMRIQLVSGGGVTTRKKLQTDRYRYFRSRYFPYAIFFRCALFSFAQPWSDVTPFSSQHIFIARNHLASVE